MAATRRDVYEATLQGLAGLADELEQSANGGERLARGIRVYLEYLDTRPWRFKTPQDVYEAAEAMHHAFGKFVEELEANAGLLGLVTEGG